MKKLTNKEFNLSFHETTIKSIWSIVNTFSQIMLSLFPKSELIDKSIKDFVKKTGAQAMVVLDNNSLVIGQEYESPEIKGIIQVTTPYFLTLNESISERIGKKRIEKDTAKASEPIKYDVILEDKEMIISRSKQDYIFEEFNLKKFKKPMYLMMIRGDKAISTAELNSFISIFKNYL